MGFNVAVDDSDGVLIWIFREPVDLSVDVEVGFRCCLACSSAAICHRDRLRIVSLKDRADS